MTDPITDMLNRIRNAAAVGKAEVLVPFSTLKSEISNLLARESFISEAKKMTKGKVKLIKIGLNYENRLPKIEGAKRISKPGQRIYVKANEIKKIRQGYGISIISTPKGLMTGKEAKKMKMGGEVLFEVW